MVRMQTGNFVMLMMQFGTACDTGGGSLVYFEHLRASVRAKGSVMLVGCSCCGELRQSAVNGCRMQLKELDGKLGEARIHAHTGTQTFMF